MAATVKLNHALSEYLTNLLTVVNIDVRARVTSPFPNVSYTRKNVIAVYVMSTTIRINDNGSLMKRTVGHRDNLLRVFDFSNSFLLAPVRDSQQKMYK